MIVHLRGREKDLEPFGWSQEHAEWVAMVCLHGGVFTRAQYSAFFNAHPQQAARFVQSLVDLKLAVEEPIPVIRPRNRTRVCRTTDKGIYQALEIPKVRRRRFADPAGYLRRLLSLDYVIDHPQLEWLPTEDEKVEFCTHYGVPLNRLPQRIYGGAAGNVVHYFYLGLPIAAGPVCTFVYIDPGNDTATEMRHWGQTHEHVWAILRKRGIQIHVAADRGQSRRRHARAKRVGCDGRGIARASGAGVGGKSEIAGGIRRNFQSHRAPQSGDSRTLRWLIIKAASLRYAELKDLLATPLPYRIRIDTFEIWRSSADLSGRRSSL